VVTDSLGMIHTSEGRKRPNPGLGAVHRLNAERVDTSIDKLKAHLKDTVGSVALGLKEESYSFISDGVIKLQHQTKQNEERYPHHLAPCFNLFPNACGHVGFPHGGVCDPF